MDPQANEERRRIHKAFIEQREAAVLLITKKNRLLMTRERLLLELEAADPEAKPAIQSKLSVLQEQCEAAEAEVARIKGKFARLSTSCGSELGI